MIRRLVNDPGGKDVLLEIRARLDGIEHTQEVLVRTRSEEIWASLVGAFEQRPLLAHVYLLVDGVRTQNEIVAALAEKGLIAAGSKGTVSTTLAILRDDLHLVTALPSGKSQVHARTAVARILGLPKRVQRWVDAGPRHG